MILCTKPYFIVIACIVLVAFSTIESRRGGSGRRAGSSRGSSSIWGRTKQSQAVPSNYDIYGSGQKKVKAQQPTPQASAPPASVGDSSATFLQHEKKQQAPLQNTQQRPIGWDVNQENINRNSAPSLGNPNYQKDVPPYPSSGVYGSAQRPGSYANTGQMGPPPLYSNPGMTPQHGAGYGYNYGNSYPQQQYNPSFPNSNFGPPPPGYNYNNNHGQSGMFGNLFGGNKYGSNGFGGYGGAGLGGYGKRFGGGFGSGFSKNAYRNAFFGLLVWNLVSGLTRRPYYVYNYYNNPEKIPQEISLPANVLVLCNDNVTTLCAQNTAPLCTSNGTILCVTLAQQTVPCGNDSSIQCVNSTVSDVEDNDSNSNGNKSSSVNIPCVTNATIVGKMLNNTAIMFNGTQALDESTSLCVTTLAQPQPEEDAKLCTANNSGCQPPELPIEPSATINPINSTYKMFM